MCKMYYQLFFDLDLAQPHPIKISSFSTYFELRFKKDMAHHNFLQL